MVKLRALATPFILFLLIIFSFSILIHYSAENFGVRVAVKNPVEESNGKWERKNWMNHGSFRGPRKHLVNPTLQQPFQADQLPV